MKKISIQNVEIEFLCDVNVDLMVLGGRVPSCEWLRSIDFYNKIWAVDKGIDICSLANIKADFLIGDGDSADCKNWNDAKNYGAKVYSYPVEKDLTDFQLALDLYDSEQNELSTDNKLFLTGAWGGRFDHLWSLFISALNSHRIPIGIADERETIIFLNGESSLHLAFDKKPLSFSLISFSQISTGITTDGLKWELENFNLEYKNPFSISNEVLERTVDVSLKSGQIGVYWYW
ncbi:MAG: thiamine diphosphokinase [Synergistaceae bacterium]